MKSFIKSGLLLSGFTFLLAIIFVLVSLMTDLGDDIMLVLFPGLWAFFSGTTAETILLFIGITAVSYLIAGFVFAGVHIVLKNFFSNKKVFLITACIPIIIFAGVVFSQYREYANFYHIGATPEDCAALEAREQGWCYRTLYREYSIPEVCLHPGLSGAENGDGEAEECARRYGAKSGTITACSVFQESPLFNDCRWGVAFINKDKALCKQLPADDGHPEYSIMSTQHSCIEVIDKHWENNVDFYLHGKI